MAISRLFTEIGKDVDRLNASLRDAMNTAKEAGIKVEASGQRMIAAFDRALNPTKDLAEQIQLLEKVGKSGSDIWAVYSNQMKSAADAAMKNGQAVDPLIKKHLDLNAHADKNKISFESLGRTLQDFAQNPLEATKAGIMSLMSHLGPTAVGIAAVGTAAGIAGKYLFDFAASAADQAEKLENLSVTTGLSTQKIQALQQIAKEAGLEGLDLAKIIGQLNQQLGSPEGGDFTRALVANGIALEDSNGRTKDVIVLLDELKSKFIDIVDPADRVQAMHAALGGRLREIIPLLMLSSKSLAEQMSAMQATGPVLDKEILEKLLKFDERLDKIGRTWDKFVIKFKAGVASVLEDAAELGESAGSIKDKLPWWLTTDLWNADPNKDIAQNKTMADAMNGLRQMQSPFDRLPPAVNQNLTLLRETYIAQQRLIAKNEEFIDIKLRMAQAEKDFEAAANRGQKSEIARQAQILAGLNAELKARQDAKQQADQMTAALAEAMSASIENIEKYNAASMKSLSESAVYISIRMQELAGESEAIFKHAIDNVNKKFTEELFEPDAIKKRLSTDWLSDATKDKSAELQADFDNQYGRVDNFFSGLDRLAPKEYTWEDQLDTIKQYYTELEDLRANDYISEEEYSKAKESLQAEESKTKIRIARGMLGELAMAQTSHIRQIAAIGKAAAIAEATINTYVGATNALRTGGWLGIAEMAVVLTTGFAQVAQIAAQGFKNGGLIPGGEQLIRANEAGQEFMVNASATRDYLPFLQMINSGIKPRELASAPSIEVLQARAVNVTIENYGTSKNFEVERIDENTVRIIARDEAYGVLSRRGPDVIASDLADPNSRTSKAVARHTTAKRADR